VEYLSFRLGEEEYAIDILQVQEIRAQESVTRIANTPKFVRGVISLRGQIVPIVDMRAMFDLPHAAAGSSPVMIILDIGRRVIGVVVDAVSDVVRLAAGEVKPAPTLAAAIDSACVRGLAPVDGRMLIIVDIARLMASRDLAPIEEAA
jgi:purine-binding chemotaxis protein CheW